MCSPTFLSNLFQNVLTYFYIKFISECAHLLFYQIYFRMCSPTFISNLFQNMFTYFFIKLISECVHLLLSNLFQNVFAYFYQIIFRMCSPTFMPTVVIWSPSPTATIAMTALGEFSLLKMKTLTNLFYLAN